MTEKDLQEQLENAGFDDATVTDENIEFGEEITGEDILETDLEEQGVPREIIEEAVQEWEADRKYRQERDSLVDRVQQKSSSAPKFLKSVGNALFRWPSVPTTATVTSVSGVSDGIEITISPNQDADTRHSERTVTLETDGLRMRHLLATVGVEKPSDLKGEDVPVKPTRSFGDLDFELDTPRNRAGSLPVYYWKRALVRGRSFELKEVDKHHHHSSERIRPNRNFWLLNSVILGLLGGGLSLGTLVTGSGSLSWLVLVLLSGTLLVGSGLTAAAYASAVVWTFLVGTLLFLFGDRR